MHRLFTLRWQDSAGMEINFPHRDRNRLAPLTGQPIDFAALVGQGIDPANVNLMAWFVRVAERPTLKADPVNPPSVKRA